MDLADILDEKDDLWVTTGEEYMCIYYKDNLLLCALSDPDLENILIMKAIIDIAYSAILEEISQEDAEEKIRRLNSVEDHKIKRVKTTIKLPKTASPEGVPEMSLLTRRAGPKESD